jgi:hypothetical protein
MCSRTKTIQNSAPCFIRCCLFSTDCAIIPSCKLLRYLQLLCLFHIPPSLRRFPSWLLTALLVLSNRIILSVCEAEPSKHFCVFLFFLFHPLSFFPVSILFTLSLSSVTQNPTCIFASIVPRVTTIKLS